MPRLSSASAISSADRRVVPRSMVLESRYIAPGASAGSHIDPARMAMFIVTAGVVLVRFASRTAPFFSAIRAGASPEEVTSGCFVNRYRIEQSDRSIRLGQNRARRPRALLERDSGDPWPEVREDVDAGDRLEVTDLVRDVRDAVVLKHEARVQLCFRFGELTGRDSTSRDLRDPADQFSLAGHPRR